MYDNLTSSGVPPTSVAATPKATARNPVPVTVPEGAALPLLGVARQLAGREIQRLLAAADGIDRELSRSVIGASGQPIAHKLAEMPALRDAAAKLRAEADGISAMTDGEVRAFAYERGAR
jgi:hypothetical protein